MKDELVVGVVNIGYGNVKPIINILKRSYINAQLVEAPEDFLRCEKLIIPGVGAFDNFMSVLKSRKLDEAILAFARSGKAILGICVGAQILGKSSEEGKCLGLSLIDMKVKKFNFGETTDLPVPHMGWNTLDIVKNDGLLKDLEGNNKFYFAHSYHFDVANKKDVMTYTNYGYKFCSIAGNKKIIAIQFHPEKSHDFGFKILQNFCYL